MHKFNMLLSSYKVGLHYFCGYVALLFTGMMGIKYKFDGSAVTYSYQDWVYLFYNGGNKFNFYYYLYFVALTWLALFIWQLRTTYINLQKS